MGIANDPGHSFGIDGDGYPLFRWNTPGNDADGRDTHCSFIGINFISCALLIYNMLIFFALPQLRVLHSIPNCITIHYIKQPIIK